LLPLTILNNRQMEPNHYSQGEKTSIKKLKLFLCEIDMTKEKLVNTVAKSTETTEKQAKTGAS